MSAVDIADGPYFWANYKDQSAEVNRNGGLVRQYPQNARTIQV